METLLNTQKGTKIILHEGESWFEYYSNLCVTSVMPFIFTGTQKVKTGLFHESNCVRFVDR